MGNTTSTSPRSLRWAVDAQNSPVALAICVLLGATLAWLDMQLRLPLHLPGRRGLTQMALLVLAMQFTRQRWAATATTSSAALLLTLRADADHKLWFLLVAGIAFDALRALRPAWRDAVLWLMLCGAVANGLQAVLKWLANVTFHDVGQGHGQWFFYPGLLTQPLLSHAAFGALGALLGWLIWRGARRDQANSGQASVH